MDNKHELIPLFKVFMSEKAGDEVAKTLNSGMITQSSKVEEFETRLKKWFEYEHILTLNSATSGLTLALRLLNLGERDEVLCTPLTCMATNLPVLSNNLNIKWVDVDPKTCNMDLEDAKKKITYTTRALLFVHWAGIPIDLDKVTELKEYTWQKFGFNLHVIEDCAHAMGAEYKDRKIGSHGDNICVFSLQAIKHLTTGDGGLITLPNKKLYDRAKLLRWFGLDRNKRSGKGKDFRLESDVTEWGYKYHMNDINATIGLCNLEHLDWIVERFKKNAETYREKLKDVPSIELLEINEKSSPSYWIFTIKVKGDKPGFIKYMGDNNIVVSQVHNRNDVHTCLEPYKRPLPALDMLETQIVSIPVGWWLNDEDIDYVVETIKRWEGYNIWPLERKDAKEYLRLLHQLTKHGTIEEGVNNLLDKYWRMTDQDGTIYVLKGEDGTIRGTAKLLIEYKLYQNVGHIEDVVVDEKYRGKGYGTFLLQFLKEKAKEADCYKVILDCKEELRPFYGKEFREEGIMFAHRF